MINPNIDKANGIAAKIESEFGTFWEANVWVKNENVCFVFITSGKKRCGYIDVSGAGVKVKMSTLRDTNRVNSVLEV